MCYNSTNTQDKGICRNTVAIDNGTTEACIVSNNYSCSSLERYRSNNFSRKVMQRR